jgi:hypothetical protein
VADGNIIRRMRFACCITKAIYTHMHTECNIYCFSTAKMVSRTPPQYYIIRILPLLLVLKWLSWKCNSVNRKFNHPAVFKTTWPFETGRLMSLGRFFSTNVNMLHSVTIWHSSLCWHEHSVMFYLYFMCSCLPRVQIFLAWLHTFTSSVHICFHCVASLMQDWTLPTGTYTINMFGYIVLYPLLMYVNVFQVTREFTLHTNFQHTYTRVGWEYISCRLKNKDLNLHHRRS